MKNALRVQFILLLFITMILSIGGVGAAEEIVLSNTPVEVDQAGDPLDIVSSTGQTTVSFSIMNENYFVYIPAAISFSDKKTNVITSNLTVTDVSIKGTNVLFINVTSQHGFKMYRHTDEKGTNIPEVDISQQPYISYNMTYYPIEGGEVKYDENNYNEDTPIVLMKVNTGTARENIPLRFMKTGTAGDLDVFKDQLNFIVESKAKDA